MPICLAGLGWGWTTAAVAALTGTLVVGGVLGPAAGAIFAVAIALPIAVLCYLALLSRPAAAPQGQTGGARMVSDRAPRRLGGAHRPACLPASRADPRLRPGQLSRVDPRTCSSHSALKDLDRDGTVFTESTIASLSSVLARTLPAAFAIVWLTITLFNLWLAGRDRRRIRARAPALA